MIGARTRSLVSLAAAAALVWPVSQIGPAAASTESARAAAPTVRVVPGKLPVGRRPQVAYVDDNVLYRPGKAPVSLESFGRQVTQLFRARGGYLVTYGISVGFVSDSGRKRVVVRSTLARVTAVATDGRSFVGTRRVERDFFVQRYAVSDGRKIGKVLRNPGAILTVTPHHLVTTDGAWAGERFQTRTRLWSTTTGKAGLIATGARSRYPETNRRPPNTHAASRAAHAVSVDRPSGRQVVVDTRTKRTLWHTDRYEALALFSPGSKRVLTFAYDEQVSGELPRSHPSVRKVSVRSARSGARLVSFTGHFTYDGDSGDQFVWENSDSFLITAYDRAVGDEDGEVDYVNRKPIRCSVSKARCQAVLDDPHDLLDGRRLLIRASE